MFNYVPIDKSRQRFYSSYPTEQVATIDELVELCKARKVERVIIPYTFDFEGYGADLVSLSNSRSIKRDYKNRVKAYGHELSISAWQFMNHEEFRELIQTLQEDYPLYDEEDHSMLESERHEDFLVDEIYYALDKEDVVIMGGASASWDRHYIREVLHSGSYLDGELDRLEWWELVSTDNDGLTPYMRTEDFDAFLIVFKERARGLGFKL